MCFESVYCGVLVILSWNVSAFIAQLQKRVASDFKAVGSNLASILRLNLHLCFASSCLSFPSLEAIDVCLLQLIIYNMLFTTISCLYLGLK